MAVQSTQPKNVKYSSTAALSYWFENSPGNLVSPTSWQKFITETQGQFGANIELYTPKEIKEDRQQQAGEIARVRAGAQFSTLLRQYNNHDFLEGITFAPVHEYGTLTKADITEFTSTQITTSANALSKGFGVPTDFDLIVYIEGLTGSHAGNNGVHTATASDATSISIAGLDAVGSADVPDDIRVFLAGYRSKTTTPALTVTDGVVKLTGLALPSTSKLRVGSWLNLGGVAEASKFSSGDPKIFYTGNCRIGAFDSSGITLDIVPFPPAAAAAQIGLEVWLPTRGFRNGLSVDPFYFQFERKMGKAPGTNSQQAEYVEGAVANTLSLTTPSGEAIKTEWGVHGDGCQNSKNGA